MAEVIIGLGCNFLNPENVRSMTARAQKAAQLYLQGEANKILFSGGFNSRKDISEARFMSELAMKAGVPSKDIILEEQSTRTLENADLSKGIIDREGFSSLIVVTSPWHIRRAKFLFEKAMPGRELEMVNSEEKESLFRRWGQYWKEFWESNMLSIPLFRKMI
jgi:uncharacterized SAM-binding protein YcdF (DUF218 family)